MAIWFTSGETLLVIVEFYVAKPPERDQFPRRVNRAYPA
jgi:hypothetical protein